MTMPLWSGIRGSRSNESAVIGQATAGYRGSNFHTVEGHGGSGEAEHDRNVTEPDPRVIV